MPSKPALQATDAAVAYADGRAERAVKGASETDMWGGRSGRAGKSWRIAFAPPEWIAETSGERFVGL